MEVGFRNILVDMDIYSVEISPLYLDVDIYGYEQHVYYQEFRLLDYPEIEFEGFSLIDLVKYGEYGFIEDDEYTYDSWICTDPGLTKFSIESIIVEPFKKEVTFVYLIKGEPDDIANLAFGRKLYVELYIGGCRDEILFWQQSMYLSYLTYKNNNILGSFMHLFIAFEGMLRYLTKDTKTPDLKTVYRACTSHELPKYINRLKKLRNKIMHGNENALSQLSEADLEALLGEIRYLYNNYNS
ncbi:hypothetical protein CN539_22090 [Bacillus toyonensis]|uniref:hypothetical protein n=1 Tax=Bacillus TaxID=1386 RepID=UPI0002D3C37C|nr:hypothetical protein [Bacillus toyonensis]KAB0447652.1 hypothetical protein CH334_13690 [Lysinibacillus sp. VIA-II-2016]PEF96454.1 hypothetical protein COO01_24135 [Bacillus toyonensis]PEM59829.1 hypothetical protein CN625_21055 [Bacillus toyonensis]PEN71560.1 hypothetical protein CN539_22090 [Bacillus toyonensis]HDR7500783.1 hypothetical protein [Bacillus toyonensis]